MTFLEKGILTYYNRMRGPASADYAADSTVRRGTR